MIAAGKMQTFAVFPGGKMPPGLARWEACRHAAEATSLVASQCGFQPRFPKADSVVIFAQVESQ